MTNPEPLEYGTFVCLSRNPCLESETVIDKQVLEVVARRLESQMRKTLKELNNEAIERALEGYDEIVIFKGEKNGN